TTPVNEAGVYEPGQTVEYQVKVTDHNGEPVQAELSLALIDKAVLTLAPEPVGQLIEAFWHARALDVRTASGLTLALERINRALDEKKGGGGGDGAAGLDSVRRNFADTVLWLPELVTDANGEATAEATLPDNLTTWVLLAKGITGDDTLVGEARSEIVTSKPLLVRPVTPRFFVIGDEAQLGLIMQNNGEETLTVTPSFEATGVEIGDWRLGDGVWQGTGEVSEITVEPGEEVKIEYQVVVADAAAARLTMGAASTDERYSDGIAFELPIYHLSTPETVATVGVLDESSTRLEGIALPRAFDPSQGALTVTIEPSLAAGLRGGLSYLEHFPYECVEQTVSRFLPNIFTYRAYQTLALENPALAQRLPDLVGVGLQRLITQQNMDGGWGWWAGSESDPFLSGYVLLGLVEARRSDFAVEQWIVDNAVNYLNQSLVAPQDMAEPWQANRQAFTLYVLAEAGQGDLSRAVALFERREKLDLYGRAFLALAIHQADAQADQIDTLLSDLTSGAVVSATGAHWEEAQPDLVNMNSDSRSTAIIVAALARLQPDHPLLPQAVRWLMTMREQQGAWSSTQETAWAIIGLTDWLAVSGELEAAYAWQVSLNGQPLGDGVAEPASLDETTNLAVDVNELLAEAVNRLAVERDSTVGAADDAGRLYYGAYLTYFKPVEQVTALDRGIIVSREYLSLPATSEGGTEGGASITEAAVGDFIQVKLTLIAPHDLHYVMVEDYLPAGTEAVDSSLATTSLVGQPPQVSRADQPFGAWYFTHTDLRDEKAVLFADYLPQGVYEYTYTIRASTPGQYRVIPTHAEQMYFPEVFGRSDGGLFTVVGE
ncbi:MAG: alpha-2-macroglobulin, partial [Anaerolineae bacterium]|nr:alpha-2-macroglobulin [Anaerolineae bacterium]